MIPAILSLNCSSRITFAGSDLEGGLGRYYLQANLTDQAEHTETANLSLPVSENSLIIEAVPEGGQFRPNVENILYVLTSYPDGSPAPSELTLSFYDNGETIEAETGDYGLAEIRRTPLDWWQGFSISAEDDQGNQAYSEFYFEGNWAEESILLRPDKAVYRVGESMQLSLLASQPSGTVYLDIIREGQTVSTRSVDLQDKPGRTCRGPHSRSLRHPRTACLQDPYHRQHHSRYPSGGC